MFTLVYLYITHQLNVTHQLPERVS